MKKNRRRIMAVLFDWDFTLVYTLEKDLTHIERTAALFEHEGISYTVDEFRRARQMLLRDIALGQVDGTIKPQTKPEILLFYQQLLERLGHPEIVPELAYRLYVAYGRLPTTLYDDVLPTLQGLKRQGLKLGLLSNHSTTVRATMEAIVGHLIPSSAITISEEAGLHKPHPAIFQQAAASVHTPPAECMYVGDNLEVDAIGAVVQGGFGMGLWLDRANRGTMQDIPPNVVRITLLSQVLDFVPSLPAGA